MTIHSFGWGGTLVPGATTSTCYMLRGCTLGEDSVHTTEAGYTMGTSR
jgi:hypothetical protein